MVGPRDLDFCGGAQRRPRGFLWYWRCDHHTCQGLWPAQRGTDSMSQTRLSCLNCAMHARVSPPPRATLSVSP